MIIVFMMSGVALITRPNFLGFTRDSKTTLSIGEFKLKKHTKKQHPKKRLQFISLLKINDGIGMEVY